MTAVSSRSLPVVSLLLAMLLWGSSFVALKVAFQSCDPMVVIFGRMFVASLCFLGFAGRYRGGAYRRGDLKWLLFMALCEPCLYFVFEAKAVQNTTVSQAGMITAMLPLLVAVAARLFLKERTSRSAVAGFMVAIAGVCWLSLAGAPSASAPHPILGNTYELIAMVCASGYTVTLKRLSLRYHPFFLTALQAFIGCLFFLPFLFLPTTTLPTHWEATPLVCILYLGVCITLGAYGLYNYGISRLPASQASAFVNLIPVFTILLGWLILGEQFTSMQYVASGVVFAGVLLSQMGQGGAQPEAVPEGLYAAADTVR